MTGRPSLALCALLGACWSPDPTGVTPEPRGPQDSAVPADTDPYGEDTAAYGDDTARDTAVDSEWSDTGPAVHTGGPDSARPVPPDSTGVDPGDSSNDSAPVLPPRDSSTPPPGDTGTGLPGGPTDTSTPWLGDSAQVVDTAVAAPVRPAPFAAAPDSADTGGPSAGVPWGPDTTSATYAQVLAESAWCWSVRADAHQLDLAMVGLDSGTVHLWMTGVPTVAPRLRSPTLAWDGAWLYWATGGIHRVDVTTGAVERLTRRTDLTALSITWRGGDFTVLTGEGASTETRMLTFDDASSLVANLPSQSRTVRRPEPIRRGVTLDDELWLVGPDTVPVQYVPARGPGSGLVLERYHDDIDGLTVRPNGDLVVLDHGNSGATPGVQRVHVFNAYTGARRTTSVLSESGFYGLACPSAP